MNHIAELSIEKFSIELLENQSNFILYTGNDEKVNVDVFVQDGTIWLTQKTMGNLFGKSKATISENLKKIYAEEKLQMDSTLRNFRTVQVEGSRQVERYLEYYNLDAIISVGYRVNSYQATQFRIWATRTLKEYIIKGFVLDDERLKEGNRVFGRYYSDKISTNINQILPLPRLRDTLLPKLMSGEVRVQLAQGEAAT